ncbi:MAG: hypothetical protein ACRELC_00775 [Gemmatimonadota bacterium]
MKHRHVLIMRLAFALVGPVAFSTGCERADFLSPDAREEAIETGPVPHAERGDEGGSGEGGFVDGGFVEGGFGEGGFDGGGSGGEGQGGSGSGGSGSGGFGSGGGGSGGGGRTTGPSSMTLLASFDGATIPNAHNPRGNLSVQRDTNGNEFWRVEVPAGLVAGTASRARKVLWVAGTSTQRRRTIYLAFDLRTPRADYELHPVLQKLFYFGYGGYWGGYSMIALRGPGTANGNVLVDTAPLHGFFPSGLPGQATCGRGCWIRQSGAQFDFGTGWHRYEVLLSLNDIGRRNGIYEVRLDGRTVAYRQDVEYVRPESPWEFWRVKFDPIYGGVGTVKTRDDELHFDNIEIRAFDQYVTRLP